VIWIRGSGEIRLMTGIAGGWSCVVAVVDVALSAGHGGVHAREGIVGIEGVIEGGVEPVSRRVADGAIVRQAKLDVRWIVAVDKVGSVASEAGCGRSLEDIVDVACSAGQSGVRPGERVARVLQVVEFGVEPTVHGVAGLARGGKAQPYVVDHRRQEVLLMT